MPTTRTYEYERYVTTPDQVRTTLDEFGVAIVPNVLDADACERMKTNMFDFLEHATADFDVRFDRTNPASWRTFSKLMPKHSMLVQEWGIGQSQFNWDVRQHPNVYGAFARIWDVRPEELLVSFDGASFHFPPEITGLGWYRGNNWLHCDQSFQRNGFECAQGWINAFDTNPGDATLTVLEGSHRFHHEFKERFGIETNDDWFKLENADQHEFYVREKGCRQTHIRCPAGSLVLWDSRTIHSGTEAERGRPVPNTRCVSYVCFTPRSLATPAMLRKKIKAFEELRTTSHWPHKPKLFGKVPRMYGAPVPPVREVQAPNVCEAARTFIGY